MNLSVPFWSSELIHESFATFLKEQFTQKKIFFINNNSLFLTQNNPLTE